VKSGYNPKLKRDPAFPAGSFYQPSLSSSLGGFRILMRVQLQIHSTQEHRRCHAVWLTTIVITRAAGAV